MLQRDSTVVEKPGGVLAGWIILTCGVLSLIVISHHPVAHGHDPDRLLQQIAALRTIDQAVHGTLIALMLALAFGFCVFAQRQGLFRHTVLAGLIAYLTGIAALVPAALIDGFFTPMVAAANVHATGPALTTVLGVLAGGGAMIQVLSKFGFYALSFAIFVWSAGMMRAPGPARYAGIAGMAAALLPVAIVAFTHALTPASLMLVIVCQAVWYTAIGALLVRRDL